MLSRIFVIKQKKCCGNGRTTTSVIFRNENGDEFYPTLSWKPLKDGVKIGTKSKKMEEFIEDYNGLKNRD